jgi:hypothetical protein
MPLKNPKWRAPFLRRMRRFHAGREVAQALGLPRRLSSRRLELCAEHVRQFGSESLLPNLMEVKG